MFDDGGLFCCECGLLVCDWTDWNGCAELGVGFEKGHVILARMRGVADVEGVGVSASASSQAIGTVSLVASTTPEEESSSSSSSSLSLSSEPATWIPSSSSTPVCARHRCDEVWSQCGSRGCRDRRAVDAE